MIPEARLEVDGYTDSVGNVDYNLGLSQRRARAVVDYLVEHGADPDQLCARGIGKADPLYPNNSAENRAKNAGSRWRLSLISNKFAQIN